MSHLVYKRSPNAIGIVVCSESCLIASGVKALGLDAGLDFHGRLHRPMAKQLAKALEPYQPLFIEGFGVLA
jgi:hypothetical protein